MWLVVAQPGDPEAAWATEELRARGLEPLYELDADTLVHDTRWEHRVTSAGVRTIIEPQQGPPIDSSTVRGVLNRLLWVSADGYVGASSDDRGYATQELQALAMSWLAGFGHRAVNRPSLVGLAGDWRSTAQWRLLAARAGLRALPYASAREAGGPPGDRSHLEDQPTQPVLVVDGIPVDPVPATVARGCAALAASAGVALLGVSFTAGWQLVDATPIPQLQRAGDAAADALATALRRRGGSP